LIRGEKSRYKLQLFNFQKIQKLVLLKFGIKNSKKKLLKNKGYKGYFKGVPASRKKIASQGCIYNKWKETSPARPIKKMESSKP